MTGNLYVLVNEFGLRVNVSRSKMITFSRNESGGALKGKLNGE